MTLTTMVMERSGMPARCPRPLPLGLSLGLVCLLSLGTYLPSVSAAELSPYSGRFELVDATAAEASRDAAVQTVAERFPRLLRKLVVKKMRKAASVTLFFDFKPGAETLSISSDRSQGWTTDLAKTEKKITSKEGKTFQLSRWMEDGALRTVARSDRGSRETLFELAENGKLLKVTTTIRIERVDKPIVYVANYRRAASRFG